jgi:hypothetical protein
MKQKSENLQRMDIVGVIQIGHTMMDHSLSGKTYSLTAPADRPLIKYLLKKIKMIVSGINA